MKIYHYPYPAKYRCRGCGRKGHNVRTCGKKTTIEELQWAIGERWREYRARHQKRRQGLRAKLAP